MTDKPVDKSTEAHKIWEEIKDKKVELFALPDQTVSMHCTPTYIEPSKLYVSLKISAFLPSLESVIGKDFDMDWVGTYLRIARKAK